MDRDESIEITLAFELDALQRLANPGAVARQAQHWSSHIGIVSDEPTHVATNFARNHKISYDFFSGMRDKRESLHKARGQPELQADRYIFIGTGENDQALASDLGWEYLSIERAAEAGGWTLAKPDDSEQEPEDPGKREGWP